MTCSRRSAGEIIWMRIDSGNSAENLANTGNMYPHIKFEAGIGEWVLKIKNASLNDSGIYFCLRKYQGNKTFMKLTYLTVKGKLIKKCNKMLMTLFLYELRFFCINASTLF